MRVLPADAYDTLELSALAYGGIGGGTFATNKNYCGYEPLAIPLCLAGHGFAADAQYPSALSRFVSWSENDSAVEAINLRKSCPQNARVTWEEYCVELNIVRGE